MSSTVPGRVFGSMALQSLQADARTFPNRRGGKGKRGEGLSSSPLK